MTKLKTKEEDKCAERRKGGKIKQWRGWERVETDSCQRGKQRWTNCNGPQTCIIYSNGLIIWIVCSHASGASYLQSADHANIGANMLSPFF